MFPKAVNPMSSARLRRLRAAGWKIGTTKNFLELSDKEARLMELKLSLAGALKRGA